MRIAGFAQTALGIVCVASGTVSQAVGTQSSGDIFNLFSGVALSFLGFKGSKSVRSIGVPIISGLNGLIGIPGLIGVYNVAGIPLNEGVIPNMVNIGISVWGFVSTSLNKPKK